MVKTLKPQPFLAKSWRQGRFLSCSEIYFWCKHKKQNFKKTSKKISWKNIRNKSDKKYVFFLIISTKILNMSEKKCYGQNLHFFHMFETLLQVWVSIQQESMIVVLRSWVHLGQMQRSKKNRKYSETCQEHFRPRIKPTVGCQEKNE